MLLQLLELLILSLNILNNFSKLINYLFNNNTSLNKKLKNFPEPEEQDDCQPLPLEQLRRETLQRELRTRVSEVNFFDREIKAVQLQRRKAKKEEEQRRLGEEISQGIADMFTTVDQLDQFLIDNHMFEAEQSKAAEARKLAEAIRGAENEWAVANKKALYSPGQENELSNISLI